MKNTLFEDRERWILWIPVLFGSGIFIYFDLKSEPELYIALSFALFSLAGLFFSYRKILFPFFLIFFITSAGFATATLRGISVNSPMAKRGLVHAEATVERIENLSYGKRITFVDNDLHYDKTGEVLHLVKMRLDIHKKMENILPGNRVSFRAYIYPPTLKPVYPSGFDFSRYAYFKQIGALGYTISDVRYQMSDVRSSTKIILSKLRLHVTNRILESFEDDSLGHIATALITGERGGIDSKILKDMRMSGMAHLLAISGLHLGLVMVGIFFVVRSLLALSVYITIRYNIKKWAAIVALIAGLFYLILTGMPVSARRSYIMVGLFFIAILLDRTGTPMRTLALAAFIIMCFEPESVVSAGFQMSFAAVTALIAVFEKISKRMILGLLISSITAGCATAPFAMYHFGYYADYGILANLVAVPLTSLWIMPSGILSIILMPFGLEKIALIPMESGIRFLTDYAASLSSGTMIPQGSSTALAIISIGGLWLCLWRVWIRYLGIPVIVIGLLIFIPHTPDIIVNDRLFAVMKKDRNLYFSSDSHSYAKEQWLKVNAQEEEYVFSCDKKQGCQFEQNGYKIAFARNASRCDGIDLRISLTKKGDNCDAKYTISRDDLKNKGTHAIYLDSEIKIRTVEDERGNRLWILR